MRQMCFMLGIARWYLLAFVLLFVVPVQAFTMSSHEEQKTRFLDASSSYQASALREGRFAFADEDRSDRSKKDRRSDKDRRELERQKSRSADKDQGDRGSRSADKRHEDRQQASKDRQEERQRSASDFRGHYSIHEVFSNAEPQYALDGHAAGAEMAEFVLSEEAERLQLDGDGRIAGVNLMSLSSSIDLGSAGSDLAGAPEPEEWALLFIGFLCLAYRYRRQLAWRFVASPDPEVRAYHA